MSILDHLTRATILAALALLAAEVGVAIYLLATWEVVRP